MTSEHGFMHCVGEMENLVLIMKVFYLCGRINPQNEAAKKGLERLEKQMKVCSHSLVLSINLTSSYQCICMTSL